MPGDDRSALRALREAIDAAVAGDLEHEVAVPAGAGGDMASVARSFNAMLAELRARVEAGERNRVEFHRALERLGDVLGSTHDRAAMISAVLDTSALLMQARAGVFFVHSGGPRLRPVAAHGVTAAALDLSVGEGLAGWSAETGTVAVWPGPVNPSAREPLGGATTAIALPVQAGTRPFGILALYGHGKGDSYSDVDVGSLRGLLRQVSTAIENTFLYEEAAHLSITDGLTGLWNRRGFDLRAGGELQRAVRFDESFGVVMVDLDNLKQVNDHHGHRAGDGVLVELARRLTDATRDVDVVARLGGDEIVLLLPNTTLDGTLTLTAKLVERVGSGLFRVDGADLEVTVSAGVASYPEHGRSVRNLLEAADAALYRAKGLGRNQVQVAVDEAKGPLPGEASAEGDDG